MLKYICILSLVLAVGCSSAWVIKETPDGGIIGYRGNAREKIKELIHCPWEPVSDELRSENYQYTDYETVTTKGRSVSSFYGFSNGYTKDSEYTTQVPTTRNETRYWREFTYKCK